MGNYKRTEVLLKPCEIFTNDFDLYIYSTISKPLMGHWYNVNT